MINIVEKNTRIVEMNFVMKTEIDFELFDSRRSALYATSRIVDQSNTLKRSEMTRKSVFLIVILNTKFV